MTTTAPPPDELDAWAQTTGYAESCLIGAALHVSHDRANAVLNLVHDGDFADNRARMAWQLIRTVVGDGCAPDPNLVVAAAQRAGRHGTAHALASLQNYLMDAYTNVPHPGNIPAYARAVLDFSYRRRAERFGTCLRHYASVGAIADLRHLLASEPAALAGLYDRAHRPERVTAACENT